MASTLLLWASISCLHFLVTGQSTGEVHEYCMETFRPVCNADSVIVMSEARYGRMGHGRCMTQNDEFSPCFNDELSTLDRQCSGKRNCELAIPNPEMTSNLTCLEGFRPYLEAGYTCQKVMKPKERRCSSFEILQATNEVQYIASITTSETSCGSNRYPWFVQARSGQRISFSLKDFAWEQESQNSECPVNYGIIIDTETADIIDICGGRSREQYLYESKGSGVVLVLHEAAVNEFQFLLKHHAVGCPHFDPPQHSWMRQENNTIYVGCVGDVHSQHTWQLHCVNNEWLGTVGNCPKPVSKTRVERSSDAVPEVSSNQVAACAMGYVALVIICSIALLGI